VLTLDYMHFKHFLLAFPETVFALFEKCVYQLDKQQSKASANQRRDLMYTARRCPDAQTVGVGEEP